jgi:hypothetical protein
MANNPFLAIEIIKIAEGFLMVGSNKTAQPLGLMIGA